MRHAPRSYKIGILWPAPRPRFAASISTGDECDVVFAGSKPRQGDILTSKGDGSTTAHRHGRRSQDRPPEKDWPMRRLAAKERIPEDDAEGHSAGTSNRAQLCVIGSRRRRAVMRNRQALNRGASLFSHSSRIRDSARRRERHGGGTPEHFYTGYRPGQARPAGFDVEETDRMTRRSPGSVHGWDSTVPRSRPGRTWKSVCRPVWAVRRLQPEPPGRRAG